jgi:hypothetical protein
MNTEDYQGCYLPLIHSQKLGRLKNERCNDGREERCLSNSSKDNPLVILRQRLTHKDQVLVDLITYGFIFIFVRLQGEFGAEGPRLFRRDFSFLRKAKVWASRCP